MYSLLAGAKPTWFAEDIRCYVNVNEIEEHLSIQVYPNPATDEVQILVKEGTLQRCKVCKVCNDKI